MNEIEKAKELSNISKMTDNSLFGGMITPEESRKIKDRLKDMQLDNLFKAMAGYCG